MAARAVDKGHCRTGQDICGVVDGLVHRYTHRAIAYNTSLAVIGQVQFDCRAVPLKPKPLDLVWMATEWATPGALIALSFTDPLM